MLPIVNHTINCRENADYLEKHLDELYITAINGNPAAAEIIALAQDCLNQPSMKAQRAFYLAIDEYRRGRLN
jgi:hypothetical protein